MKLTRRDFVKVCLLSTFNLLLRKKDVFADKNGLEQIVNVNLPAYSLTLMNFIDGNLEETFSFPIGIGKGYDGKRQTPTGTGFVYEKRKRIILRYGKDYPNLKIKEEDIIKWTNTYDEHGKPVGYRMPYSQMRGLGMKIRAGLSNYYHDDFVIHSTTDEFTIGIPSSKGCLRVGMEDMLNLYNMISPEIEQGIINKPLPIKISYDLIELDKESIKLHANVYNKNIDLLQEFKRKITKINFYEEDFDYDKMREVFISANKEFKITHKKILNILSKNHPNNFVPSYLRENLHRTYDISFFLRS